MDSSLSGLPTIWTWSLDCWADKVDDKINSNIEMLRTQAVPTPRIGFIGPLPVKVVCRSIYTESVSNSSILYASIYSARFILGVLTLAVFEHRVRTTYFSDQISAVRMHRSYWTPLF